MLLSVKAVDIPNPPPIPLPGFAAIALEVMWVFIVIAVISLIAVIATYVVARRVGYTSPPALVARRYFLAALVIAGVIAVAAAVFSR